VITHVVAQAGGRGLGAFHADLTEARVGWSQMHRGAEITGYSFTDWSGRSAAAIAVWDGRTCGRASYSRWVWPAGRSPQPPAYSHSWLELHMG